MPAAPALKAERRRVLQCTTVCSARRWRTVRNNGSAEVSRPIPRRAPPDSVRACSTVTSVDDKPELFDQRRPFGFFTRDVGRVLLGCAPDGIAAVIDDAL